MIQTAMKETEVKIETGLISKRNWSGEVENIEGFHGCGVIRFTLYDYDFELVWSEWDDADETTRRLIGSGCWYLFGEGWEGSLAFFADSNPVHALAAAARWIWNHV